jgi:hypothetical protein
MIQPNTWIVSNKPYGSPSARRLKVAAVVRAIWEQSNHIPKLRSLLDDVLVNDSVG